MPLYALIGRKLSHSFSQEFFTRKFAAEKTDAAYRNFELKDISELPALLDAHPDIMGLNVTIPYKQAVIPYLDGLAEEARAIGAVNTVKVERKRGGARRLIGYNTDAPGFLQGLRLLTDRLPARALILGGTGGAAAAVMYALHSKGVICTPVSRTGAPSRLTYADLNAETFECNKLIVNCTPLGTYPDTESRPPIPYGLIKAGHLAYDLVYNPKRTAFMSACEAQGAAVCNGLEMLYAQARLSYRIWTQKPSE